MNTFSFRYKLAQLFSFIHFSKSKNLLFVFASGETFHSFCNYISFSVAAFLLFVDTDAKIAVSAFCSTIVVSTIHFICDENKQLWQHQHRLVAASISVSVELFAFCFIRKTTKKKKITKNEKNYVCVRWDAIM